MSSALRLAICDPAEQSRESLKKMVMGIDRVCLEADCSRYEFFSEIVDQTTPDVAIVDIDDDEKTALELIEKLNRNHPSCGVIVVTIQKGPSHGGNAAFTIALFRQGG